MSDNEVSGKFGVDKELRKYHIMECEPLKSFNNHTFISKDGNKVEVYEVKAPKSHITTVSNSNQKENTRLIVVRYLDGMWAFRNCLPLSGQGFDTENGVWYGGAFLCRKSC